MQRWWWGGRERVGDERREEWGVEWGVKREEGVKSEEEGEKRRERKKPEMGDRAWRF